MKVKNVTPDPDPVYLPALGVDVAHGEVIDVPDELGESLCEQPRNWQAVKAAKDKAADAAKDGE